MAHLVPTVRHERRAIRRSGISWTGLIVGLAVVAAIPLASWKFWPPHQAVELPFEPVIYQTQQGPFEYVVTENGEVESSENTEVRCEVQSRSGSGGGTMILELVPEGSYVHTGDLIARLDSSSLRDEMTRQQITCNTSKAAVIQARSTFEAAKIARLEYIEGTFRQEEQTKQAAVAVAEENLHRAEDYLGYSEMLSAKGYVTKLQLQADRFAVEKSRMDLAAATTDLDVLRKYTKSKMLSQLDADIESAQANLESQEKSHELDLAQLKLIEDQIAKCEIRAPSDGQVVYANKSDRRGNNEVIIEEGSPVRQRQVIVRLPDPKRMQVKAEISEARIDRIQPGMPVAIHIDALPNVELVGTVTKVEEYPVPGSWWGNSTKEYATYIKITNPPGDKLRAGMTSEVRILVERLDQALQVPVQAILEDQGRTFCFLRTPHGLQPRKVRIGSSNEKFVVIKDGLKADEKVVMNPRKFIDYVDLPEPTPEELIASKPTVPPQQQVADQAKAASSTKSTGEERLARGDVKSADKPNSTSAQKNELGKPGRKKNQSSGGMQDMTPGQLAAMMVQRMDKDGDGKLSRDELPEQFRSGFQRSDANKDGFLDKREMTASMVRLRAMRRGAGGGPAGGGTSAGGGAGG